MKLAFYTGLISTLIIGCNNTPELNDPIPQHKTFTIESKELGEKRTINIWVPQEYTTNKDSLPVLYMPDGGLKEDFPHIANTIEALIKAKKIPPIMLVGIENTQRRRDLTGYTDVAKDKEIAPVVGGSEKFRAFINNELFPSINKQYRTTNKKGIIGESLAGLFVTETFLLNSDMFNFYIAFDPSLWWNNQYLLKVADEKLMNFPSSEKRFWFAGSSAEDISSAAGQLHQILAAKKIQNLAFKYSNEHNEKHNTIFRATKEKALIWTLNSN